MKRIISITLAALLAAAALTSCATTLLTPDSSLLTSTASAVRAGEAWLRSRIGTIPDTVTIGTAADLGIDMSSFENDGYMIRTTDGDTVICAKSDAGFDRALRVYAKAYEAGVPVPDTTYHEGWRIDRLTVAGRDISEYTVVYEGESDAPGFEHNNAYFAANEMRIFIEKACGAVLPLSQTDTAHMIKIGYLTDGKHGENGFTYKVENGNVYINGVGKANGCANGVYYFLETECMWDELLYGDNFLRESDHIDIPDGTNADVDPMFDYVHPYSTFFRPFDFAHSIYNGYIGNVGHGQQSYKWGGYDVASSQICYTDPNIFDGVSEDILYYLETNREAGKKVRMVDIAQGDNTRFCHCKDCLKVIGEENLSNAGPIVRFANDLCEYIGDEFPDVHIGIFAYAGTNIPSVTHPHPNVDVTFCTDHCCAYHYIDGEDDCTYTTQFMGAFGSGKYFGNHDVGKWLDGWCDICSNVYVWHYGLDNYGHQLTQSHNFYHDFRFFADHKVKGIFYEDEYCGFGEGRLRLEMLMLLQYHPDLTEAQFEKAKADLYEREFGDGAQYILDYTRNYWSRVQLAAGCGDFWVWDVIEPPQFDIPLFRETQDEAKALLDKAISLANCERQQQNAELFACDFLYKMCWMNYFSAYDRNDTAQLEYLSEIYDTFIRYMGDAEMATRYSNLNGWYEQVGFQTNLEDAAWIDWRNFRDQLTDEGAVQRPMPEKYEGVELPPLAARAW